MSVQLPLDILREMLYKLPVEETENLCQASPELREICDRPDFWTIKLNNKYPQYQGGLIRNSPRETLLHLERPILIPIKYVDGNDDEVEITEFETLGELLQDLDTDHFILYLDNGMVIDAMKIRNEVRFSNRGNWHRNFPTNTRVRDVVLRGGNKFLDTVTNILIPE